MLRCSLNLGSPYSTLKFTSPLSFSAIGDLQACPCRHSCKQLVKLALGSKATLNCFLTEGSVSTPLLFTKFGLGRFEFELPETNASPAHFIDEKISKQNTTFNIVKFAWSRRAALSWSFEQELCDSSNG